MIRLNLRKTRREKKPWKNIGLRAERKMKKIFKKANVFLISKCKDKLPIRLTKINGWIIILRTPQKYFIY